MSAHMYQNNINHSIAVDAAHTCYESMRIISGVMKDGNGHIQCIASCLCSSESDESYTHFFELLKKYVTGDTVPEILADRHNSILNGFHNVYGEEVTINTCFVHLMANADTWTANMKKTVRNNVKGLITKMAKATNKAEAEQAQNELETLYPNIWKRLAAIPSHWTRLLTKGATFGEITSNAVEVLNSRMNRIVDANYAIRDAHIIHMVIGIYCLTQLQVHQRAEEIKSHVAKNRVNTGSITPYVLKRISEFGEKLQLSNPSSRIWSCKNESIIFYGRNMSVYNVDLENHTCTCGAWEIYGYPCIHAIAYLNAKQTPFNATMTQLVNPYYLCETVLRTCEKTLPNLPDLKSLVERKDIQQIEDSMKLIGRTVNEVLPDPVQPKLKRSRSSSTTGNTYIIAKSKKADVIQESIIQNKSTRITKRRKGRQEHIRDKYTIAQRKKHNLPHSSSGSPRKNDYFYNDNAVDLGKRKIKQKIPFVARVIDKRPCYCLYNHTKFIVEIAII